MPQQTQVFGMAPSSYTNCPRLPCPAWPAPQGTKTRHTAGRSKVLKHVKTPWHESFAFSKSARTKIPKHVADRILELNTLDTELWDLGDKLLSVRLGSCFGEGEGVCCLWTWCVGQVSGRGRSYSY